MVHWLSPRRIRPVHSLDSEAAVARFLRSLRANGWRGRPLLAETVTPGWYQAWSGTHRLAAARRAPLARVPVVLVDLAKWVRAYGRPVGCALDETRDERDGWAMLWQAGDREAAALLRDELAMNLSETWQGWPD